MLTPHVPPKLKRRTLKPSSASTLSATSLFSLPTVGRDCRIGDQQHISASEQLHLDLAAVRAQRVKLPGQIANREVHVAAARGTAQA